MEKQIQTFDSHLEKLGNILTRHIQLEMQKPQLIEWKKADDPVTNLDRELELMAHNYVAQNHLPLTVKGEELDDFNPNQMYTLHIDPIDGTKSFVQGELNSSISLCITDKNNKPLSSNISDFTRNFNYKTQDNKTRNKPFQLFENPNLLRSILVRDDSYQLLANLNNSIDEKFREQSGSIALGLARTAAGIHSGIIMPPSKKGNLYDIIAGIHLLQVEQDYEIEDFNGKPFNSEDIRQGLIALPKQMPYQRRQEIKEVCYNHEK